MNRATLVRGTQGVIAITLLTFTFFAWRAGVVQHAQVGAVFGTARPLWFVVAAAFALQEGLCGGLRMFVLGRVLCPGLRLRTAVASEFVLMFVAGITPGQLGAPVAQVATLVEGGMPFADIATAELVTAFCTIVFFLGTALALLGLRVSGLLNVPGAEALDALVGLSTAVFGACFVLLALSVLHPPALKAIFRRAAQVLGGPWHGTLGVVSKMPFAAGLAAREGLRPGRLLRGLLHFVDRVHEGFAIYRARGKAAVATAFALTLGFFWARFAVAYFILLGLGLSTTPRGFVTVGPDVVKVVVVQSLLNFALYLSPTPGASGVAEASSALLMSPWLPTAYEVPYLLLWRVLSLFLCMFVGGIYVFRYLGTEVLERRSREAEAEERGG